MRAWSWWLRVRVFRALSDKPFERLSRGVTLRVMARGTSVFPGMRSGRTHRTWGDLLLQEGRFVVASSRGKLLDLGPEHGPRFDSVRSPGPSKLVLEGTVPRPDGREARYRIEAFLPQPAEALAWVDALQPFVRAGAADEAVRFGLKPPGD